MPDPESKPAKTVEGVVEKIIKPISPSDTEKAQIGLKDAEPLYAEVRVDNSFETPSGEIVALKPGAEVVVTIEADRDDAIKKSGTGEVRIENEVSNEHGGIAALKPRAEVDVIVEADSNATMKKPA
jgi:hypothetical protein